MRAVIDEWMTELFQHNRMSDIRVVISNHRQMRWYEACNISPEALPVASPRGQSTPSMAPAKGCAHSRRRKAGRRMPGSVP